MQLILCFITVLIFHCATSGQELILQNSHAGEINYLKMSKSGQYAVTVGDDKQIKLWNKDGFLIKTFKGLGDGYLGAYLEGVFSSDDQHLYFASDGKEADSIHVIDVKNRRLLPTIVFPTSNDTSLNSNHELQIKQLAYNSEGLWVLRMEYKYPEYTEYQLIRLDYQNRATITSAGKIDGQDYGTLMNQQANRLIYSKQNKDDYKKALFNLETGQEVKTWSSGEYVKFSEEGSHIIHIGSEDGYGTTWNLYDLDGNLIQTRELDVTQSPTIQQLAVKGIYNAKYYDQSEILLVEHFRQWKGDFVLGFNLEGKQLFRLDPQGFALSEFDYNQTSERLLVGTEPSSDKDGFSKLCYYYCDQVNTSLIKTIIGANNIREMHFAQDGQSLVVTQGRGLNRLTLIGGNKPIVLPSGTVPNSAYASDSTLLVSSEYKTLKVYDDKDLLQFEIPTNEVIKRIDSDGKSPIVLASGSNFFYAVDLSKKEIAFRKDYSDYNDKNSKLLSANFVADDRYIITTGNYFEVFDENWNLVDSIDFESTIISDFFDRSPIKFNKEKDHFLAPTNYGNFKLYKKNLELKLSEPLPWLKWQENYIESSNMSNSGDRVALGDTKGKVRIYDDQANLLHAFSAHSSAVTSVTFSSDMKYLATGSSTGEIVIWKVENNFEKVLTYYLFENENYVVMSPEGYYHATVGALDKFIYWYKGNIYPFDFNDLKLNRPDIIMQKFPFVEPSTIDLYTRARQKRLSRAGIKEDVLNASFGSLPTISTTGVKFYQKTKKSDFSFEIHASDPNQLLKRLFVYVNGVPVYGLNGLEINSSSDYKTTCSFPVQQGKNLVEVSVLNEKGLESAKKRFIVEAVGSEIHPSLTVLSFGVSEFKDATKNLRYASKDAKDIVAAFETRKWKFKKTTFKHFMDKKVTKEAVLDELEKLNELGPDDVIIVHFSTHGVLDNQLNYYLAMHDTDFQAPGTRSLSYEALEELFARLKVRKKILMLDACHSGELDKEVYSISGSGSSGDQKGPVRFRASGNDLKASDGKLANVLQLSKATFNDLRKHSGTIVISSAGGAEYAYESEEWENGVFTYALLDGLTNLSADQNDDKQVHLNELRTYVFRKVEQLTHGGQIPNIRTDNPHASDFIIWE